MDRAFSSPPYRRRPFTTAVVPLSLCLISFKWILKVPPAHSPFICCTSCVLFSSGPRRLQDNFRALPHVLTDSSVFRATRCRRDGFTSHAQILKNLVDQARIATVDDVFVRVSANKSNYIVKSTHSITKVSSSILACSHLRIGSHILQEKRHHPAIGFRIL